MNYHIKRSKRKTLSIQVYRDQTVEIRAPLRCKDQEIAHFFAQHQNWVNKKLAQSKLYPGLPDSKYSAQGKLWILGKCLLIDVIEGSKAKVELEEGKLVVSQRLTNDTAKTERLVLRWKSNSADVFYRDRLKFWHEQFPIMLPHYKLKVRKMKRQWGNCNSRGIITLNSQLIRYPQECVDYVIIHELTHLKYMNHGKGFYRLLERVCPDWQQQKLILAQFSG